MNPLSATNFRSRFLFRTSKKYILDPKHLRTAFNKASLEPYVNPSPSHTHPVSAGLRTSAVRTVDSFATSMGLTPYFYQMSAADQRAGRAGSRELFWAKDLQVKPAGFKPPADGLMVMIDVDQYVDMPKFLTKHFKPTVLYTFTPSRVSKTAGEYSYTFSEENEVTYTVSGGAVYTHLVWDYSPDCLMVRRGFHCATYLVDRRRVDDDHSLILLTPLRKWRAWGPVAARLLKGTGLIRIQPAVGEFLRLTFHSAEGTMVSTGQANTLLEYSLPAATDASLALTARTFKGGLQLHHVKKVMDQEHINEGRDMARAVVLLAYHTQGLKDNNTRAISTLVQDTGVRRYQFGDYDEDATPALTSFMKPLLDGAFSPDITAGNSTEMVGERLHSQAGDSKHDSFTDRCIREFIERLVPIPHLCTPTDVDDVYERQNRPSQRKILDRAVAVGKERARASAFQKREAYGSVKPPRPIVQSDPWSKLEYSRYIYGFEHILKEQPWYGFGKTPKEIAQRVADICGVSNTILGTDFAKFEGNNSEVFIALEEAFYFRSLDLKFHNEFRELRDRVYNLEGYDKFDQRYNTGLNTNSGKPDTALSNSLKNGFNAFMSYRTVKDKRGIYMDADRAWDRLLTKVVVGGDDGLLGDLPYGNFSRTSARNGQKTTIECWKRGDVGVNFLSRFYGPNVWSGDLTSVCDLKRTLAKFHTSTDGNARVGSKEAITKLAEKAFAVRLSDCNTPIIGEFCDKAVTLLSRDKSSGQTMITLLARKKKTGNYWVDNFAHTEQYPNERNEWMGEYLDRFCADTSFDYEGFRLWLNNVQNVHGLMDAPSFAPPVEAVSKKTVVVDGDLLVGDSKQGLPGEARIKPFFLFEGIKSKLPFEKVSKKLELGQPKTVSLAFDVDVKIYREIERNVPLNKPIRLARLRSETDREHPNYIATHKTSIGNVMVLECQPGSQAALDHLKGFKPPSKLPKARSSLVTSKGSKKPKDKTSGRG